MIARIEAFFHKLRRLVSRTEWVVRLLGFAKERKQSNEPGVLLVQIDGLSRGEFDRALERGKVPFLKSLLTKEHYRVHDFYSGLPSSTPAVQAELHYGVKCAVPSFGFKDRKSGRVFAMYEHSSAKEIQSRLEKKNPPLLEGGSSFSNVYTGGAREAHFCFSSMGLAESWKNFRPLMIPVLLTFSMSILRVIFLLAIEWVLAVVDFFRGIVDGRDLWTELKFVPSRVGVCILLREAIVIRSSVDLARGLPVIHLNLAGYDEQAHRRGPTSRFAHWTLGGIDFAIKRIWKQALRSPYRDYEVLIFSDHGQEETRSYPRETGKPIRDAVCEAMAQLEDKELKRSCVAQADYGAQLKRTMLFGLKRLLRDEEDVNDRKDYPELTVSAMGPLPQVYLPDSWDEEKCRKLAQLMVEEYSIPLALMAAEQEVIALNSEGEFRLPYDAEKVLGEDHPFAQVVAEDLCELCHHPNAGRIVLSGWSPKEQPLTFPIENGAHAGPGKEETHAFLLTSEGCPFRKHDSVNPLRPLDLRKAVFDILREETAPVEIQVPQVLPTTSRRIRVMTYNIHSCIGTDGKISTRRIARVIAQHNPDVVALQEVDLDQRRTQWEDQSSRIARLLGYKWHFEPMISTEEGSYGIAVLSRFPIRPIRSGRLKKCFPRKGLEPRGAILVEVGHEAGNFVLMNTHLGLQRVERMIQARELLGPDWAGRINGTPLVLCGDFNVLPSSDAYRMFRERYLDPQTCVDGHYPRNTWSTRLPLRRIDHVFLDRSIEILSVAVVRNSLAQRASDHFPLVVDFQLPPG